MITEPITFKEADEMIRGRMDQATALKYKEIIAGWSKDARQRAFFSARVADATILSEIHRRVNAVVNGTMTKKQAVRLLRESFAGQNADALAALGFAPKSDAKGMAELASIPRLKLIMEQNTRMAQECGHYQQWEAVKDYYPIGVWHCGYAEVHRPEHLARDGKAFEFGHPIWTQSPPGGEFNCHCWRENLTREAAAARGLVPETADFPFQPSSLGFDPSMSLDRDSVQPGKRVMPQYVQQAKDAECPDDVLKDMDAGTAEEEEARRIEAINEAAARLREDMGKDAENAAKWLARKNPDRMEVLLEANERALKEERGLPRVSAEEHHALRKKYEPIVKHEMQAPCREAAEKLKEQVPELYTADAMKYGRPPKVVWAPKCDRTELSPDGFEMLIGKDIADHPEDVEKVLKGLDFVGQMKKGQEYRRDFARRQLEEAKILGIDVKDITFVNDLETRERLREEAIKMTNPKFSTGLWEYHNNCQRCVVAAELRRKGFNVVAKPCMPKGVNDATAENWEKLNAPAGSFIYTYTNPTKKDVSAEIIKFGEGSRATVYVNWGNNSAHVFCAEVHHGEVLFYDPQQGKDNYVPFASAKGTPWGICRVDNVVQKDYIKDVIEILNGRM